MRPVTLIGKEAGIADFTADVFIAGAGPVGLSLALDLGRRGVRVIIAETRGAGDMTTVRCNHVAARTMEFFRLHGIADNVRDAGLPHDYPQGVSYRTTTTGPELTRIHIPSRADRFTERDNGPDGWWPTPEPPHRVNQIYLEPILVDAVQSLDMVDLHYGTEAAGFYQSDDRVTVDLHDLQTGAHKQITSKYMVGCDGGRSPTRKAIGAKLSGDAVIQRVQSTYILAPDLIERMREDATWAMFSLNPRRTGNVYAIDGRERWLVHNYLREDEADFGSVDRDACIRTILGVGQDFHYDVLNHEDWFGRRLMTDKMRQGRVYICGDAAHLWVPYAGYGMNAGIADAADLGWQLAALVKGWGGPAMRDAYEAERLPITEQVSHYAMDHCVAMAKQRSAVPPEIEDATPEGAAARKQMATEAYALNVQQYCCAGLNFGYYYDQSPLISYDGEQQPDYSMSEYTPSTVPGCRMPHFWLAGGRSLYDELGADYVLIRFDPDANGQTLVEAAQSQGVPLAVLDIPPGSEVPNVCESPLVLVRPDRHVAWRGTSPAIDAATAIIGKACGMA